MKKTGIGWRTGLILWAVLFFLAMGEVRSEERVPQVQSGLATTGLFFPWQTYPTEMVFQDVGFECRQDCQRLRRGLVQVIFVIFKPDEKILPAAKRRVFFGWLEAERRLTTGIFTGVAGQCFNAPEKKEFNWHLGPVVKIDYFYELDFNLYYLWGREAGRPDRRVIMNSRLGLNLNP